MVGCRSVAPAGSSATSTASQEHPRMTPPGPNSAEAPDPSALVLDFDHLRIDDVARVGGKNASLGEMIGRLSSAGVRVPGGFATTAHAYRAFLAHNRLERTISDLLSDLEAGKCTLDRAGGSIREAILGGQLQPDLVGALSAGYRRLAEGSGVSSPSVAVRSSATAEDLPDASFAGQQESFLNVVGEAALLDACLRCFASLFTDRAISYRREKGFDHMQVALSVGVQRMVRSDLAASGVLFTLDPDSGFPHVVVINGAFGLGENVVKGVVNPDQFAVFKPLLDDGGARPILERVVGSKEEKMIYRPEGGAESVPTTHEERRSLVLQDDEVLALARWGVEIERHYGRPMDVEWAKDGEDGLLYIVQARPETVEARKSEGTVETFTLSSRTEPLVSGVAVGSAIVSAPAYRIDHPSRLNDFPDGGILVAARTDPDWGPGLARAAGVVTDQGGRTSHAAIVSRELGIPAVVGTGNGTKLLPHGETVTLSCAEGDRGFVYSGALPFEREELDLSDVPEPRTRIMLNVGNPDAAFRWWRLPARGIGLARLEFVIGEVIRIHPLALVHRDRVPEGPERDEIDRLLEGWSDPREYFVELLTRGIARLAAAAYPHPAVVRTSDFKSNEYAKLLGGGIFEPSEENPMLGLRGASRYYSDLYREAFLLECEALRRVRSEVGLKNVIPMIPFCRTPGEADRVLDLMASAGLRRGEDDLQVYVMCEIPSNVISAEAFAERFDGFSIGSNDLTQLVLGVDRDSADLAHLFDERDPAVQNMISDVIRRCRSAGVSIGICGQAPSDREGFAEFLVRAGIDSMSLNPDSIVDVVRRVAALEAG
jgi:pyruvate,water dikinase